MWRDARRKRKSRKIGIANNNNKTTIMPMNNTPNADGANTINIMMRVVISGLRLIKSIIESINADKKFISYLTCLTKNLCKITKKSLFREISARSMDKMY
jgi:hypothetical protein